MKTHFKRRDITLLGCLALSVCLVMAFQNCGKGFNAPLSEQLSEFQSSLANSTVLIQLPTNLPAKLSETVYFTQKDKINISNFKLYEPQYPLYSDAATKKRWIYLPPGSQIDTTNLDSWDFPLGSILWKEFSINGRKVETRMMEKINVAKGSSSWRTATYLWKTDQTDADLMVDEDFYTNPQASQNIYEARAVEANFKVATPSQCISCHAGGSDFPLGFNYLQLSSSAKAVNIFSLKNENKFTNPPVKADEIPGSANDKAAIGYIQGNCAHCHNGVNQARNFRHNSSVTSLSNEPLIITAVAMGNLLVEGSPETSILYLRFQGSPTSPGGAPLQRMPRLGTLLKDPAGESILNTWITGLDLP